jgi:peptidoglycan/xylan/chitin deacetylase (PgdA/CDA1 family)
MRSFVALLVLTAAVAHAGIEFSSLDLADDNTLLFAAAADAPGVGRYRTLFVTDLDERSIRQLTLYPEVVTRVGSGVQVQNRYGTFRTNADLTALIPVSDFASFAAGERIARGKVTPHISSPDGKFLVFVERRSDLRGELILFDIATSGRTTISTDVAFAPSGAPARWSPDSTFLVYEKAGRLYYFSTEQLSQGRVLAESFREVGPGRIASAQWGASDLYYVEGSLVFRLDSRELFTRSLYAELLRIGRIVGELPFSFDANFDSFSVAPTGSHLLLRKGERNLILVGLSTENRSAVGSTAAASTALALPHLRLPRNATVEQVVWFPDGGVVTVLIQVRTAASVHGEVYRAELAEAGPLERRFDQTATGDIRELHASADGTRVALVRPDSVDIRDHRSWQLQSQLQVDDPLTAVWVGPDRLVVAGGRTIELHNLGAGSVRLLALAQADAAGFAEDGKTIVARVGGATYTWSNETDWSREADSSAATPQRDPSPVSPDFRVFLDQGEGEFDNMVMVRDLDGLITRELVETDLSGLDPLGDVSESVDFANFAHGSRVRRRELALVFNAIGATEGLARVLRTLDDFGATATFFVNGDFIRRHPDAVRDIAASGHEVGSMFFVNFEMTDARFRVDEEFVRGGLARNEDEYFAVTGSELSAIWHAPFYIVNSQMIAAAGRMNYRYVGRDVDSLDWVTRDHVAAIAGIYMGADELVERILERKRPGSIISITVGTPEGRRDDFLFQKLDILMDALMKRGYEFASASTLVEHAR